jgi:ABC-type sulfate transport system permease component
MIRRTGAFLRDARHPMSIIIFLLLLPVVFPLAVVGLALLVLYAYAFGWQR